MISATTALVDTHVHVFRRGQPVVANPRYVPGYDAESAQFLDICRASGISHAVLVQPSFYGTDNSFMCQVLRDLRDVYRGIAVVDEAMPFEPLQALLAQLAADGVVGLRLNLDGQPLPDFATGNWPRLLAWLRDMDWQVELHRDAADLPLLLGPLVDAGVRVVVDHFGRPDAALGADDPGFRHLLRTARSGRVWVKLSAAYRNGPDGMAQGTTLAAHLLDHFGPSRLVWGSDWPHTRHESRGDMPALVAQLAQWVPDAQARAQVAGTTALELFGFAPVAAAEVAA